MDIGFPVSIVRACLRDGQGGSPTAVVSSLYGVVPALTDAERGEVAARCGTSHAVFLSHVGDPSSRESIVDVRFFTTEGELPACGHGTVAALASLTQHRGVEEEFTMRVAGRTFVGRAVRYGDLVHAAFDPGPVSLRDPSPAERAQVLSALGVSPDVLVPGACVASLGRARMLVPVANAEAVAALVPDLGRLRKACDQWNLLGCYVHSAPTSTGRVVARMFAPSIGVPEDIANANSTACLAARVAFSGVTDLTVDMGDALGSPATITASTRPTPTGPAILVGGTATLTRA